MPLQVDLDQPIPNRGSAPLPAYPIRQPALILLLSCQIQADLGLDAALAWMEAGEASTNDGGALPAAKEN